MKWILLMLGLVLLIGTVSATVTFASNQIQISNGAENCTTINSSINNQSRFEDLGSNEWLSHYPIIVQSTGTFYVNSTDCDWLKLLSLNDGSPAYLENLGTLDMSDTKVTSWDTGTNAVAPESDSTRAYIYSHGTQLLANICNLSFMGYNSNTKNGLNLYDDSTGAIVRDSIIMNNSIGLVVNENDAQIIDTEIYSCQYQGVAVAKYSHPISNLTFDGLEVHNNGHYGTHYVNFECVGYTAPPGDGSMIDSTLINCISHNGYRNLFFLRGSRNLTITNCTANDSGLFGGWHSGFDFHTHCYNITVESCNAWTCENAFFMHNMGENITIKDSIAHDADNGFSCMGGESYCSIENCTAYNISGTAFNAHSSSDNLFEDCTAYNCTYGGYFRPYNWTGMGIMAYRAEYQCYNNTYDGCNFSDDVTIDYQFETSGQAGYDYISANYIMNQVQSTNSIGVNAASTPILKYSHGNGDIFKVGSDYVPCYTNGSYRQWNPSTCTIINYNVSLMPNSNQLQNLSVNHDSHSGDDRTNVTINSTVAENPTWINATMQNASHVYNISRDGAYYNQVSSDSNSIVRYQYTIAGDEWSSHDFEFTWHSSGVCAAEGNADVTQIGDIIYVYGAEKSCNMEYLYQQVSNNTALSKTGNTYFANASIYVNGTTTTLNINGVCCDWLKLNSTSGDIAYLQFDGFGEIDDTKITSWNTTISNYDNRSNESQPRAYINYANGKGNITDSTFSHLGYMAGYYYGLHITSGTSSFSVTGNVVDYNYDGITVRDSSGVTVSGNVFNNSEWHGTYVRNSDNCVVYNNEYYDNDYGIFIHKNADYNNVSYNTIEGGGYCIILWESEYNTISHNTINGSSTSGLRFYETNNNTAENNTITDCNYGLAFQNECYNNTVRNGSVHDSSTYDYYIWYSNNESSNDNHIVTTNFTTRKMNFGGDVNISSRFNYSDVSAENIWLATNITSASYFTTTRTLSNFDQYDVSWTEIWSASVSPSYELSGLFPSHEYTIYNGSTKSSQTTDTSGSLNFTIGFSTSTREVEVLYFDVDYTKSYFNVTSPILITTKTDGTNVYNRTITRYDTELPNFTMVVT